MRSCLGGGTRIERRKLFCRVAHPSGSARDGGGPSGPRSASAEPGFEHVKGLFRLVRCRRYWVAATLCLPVATPCARHTDSRHSPVLKSAVRMIPAILLQRVERGICLA